MIAFGKNDTIIKREPKTVNVKKAVVYKNMLINK